MDFFKSLAKLATVGGVAFLTVKGEMDTVPILGDMEPNSITVYILITIFKLSFWCTLSMIFLAVIDYAFHAIITDPNEQILNQEDQEILLQQPRHKETMVVILFQIKQYTM